MELSDAAEWRYVPTTQNPADDVSRGLPASEFTTDHRFFTGPKFLLRHPDTWPTFPDVKSDVDENSDPEIRSAAWVGAVKFTPDGVDRLVAKSSDLHLLLRIAAQVKRFTALIRRPGSKCDGRPVAVSETQDALLELIRRAQMASYPDELRDLKKKGRVDITSSLIKLTPFLDHRGLICVGGRIGNAPVPFGARHQIILPSRARITELLIVDIHLRLAHASSERVLHEARMRYWIPRGRLTIKRTLNKCFICKQLLRARPLSPMMAALPSYRMQPFKRAFTNTGVDYFGPIEVNIFRRKVKRWGCLFVVPRRPHRDGLLTRHRLVSFLP